MSGRELPQDHFCPWREEAEELRSKLVAVEDRLAALEQHLFGKKSEKMPSLAREVANRQRQLAKPGHAHSDDVDVIHAREGRFHRP